MKKILLFSLILAFSSCQMNSHNRVSSRSVANTNIMKNFIGEVARGSQKYVAKELEHELEKRLKAFLSKEADGSEIGNWARMGITKDQAKNINGLYDDLPYMNKVQKWVMENITTLMREIKPSIARTAYNKILGNAGSFNPYAVLNESVESTAIARRNSVKPSKFSREIPEVKIVSVADEIANKNKQLVNYTQKLKTKGLDPKTQESILKSLDLSDDFIRRNPASASNIHHSVESSITIASKTGSRGVGVGCPKFNQKASGDVLDIKSRVDMRRAQIIEEKAYEKAGRKFASVDEIPEASRLTAREIDDATEEAFEDVLGYSRKEAKAAVNRLKTPPCQVY